VNAKRMINSLLYLMIAVLVVRNGLIFFGNSELEGQRLEDLILNQVGGEGMGRRLYSFKPPIAIFFWSLSCPPCLFELGRIQSAINNEEVNPQSILAVNVSDSPETIALQMAKRKWNFPVFIDSSNGLSKQLKVQATPTVAYIDSEFKVSTVNTGVSPLLINRLSKMK